jgi:hypothetical protein
MGSVAGRAAEGVGARRVKFGGCVGVALLVGSVVVRGGQVD